MPAIQIQGAGPEGPDDSDLEFSPRGFARYGSTLTTYGEIVEVYESSSAEGPHIWLSIGVGADKHTAAHLSLEQALEIHANLDRAIERGARLFGIELVDAEDDAEDGHPT